MPSLSDFEIQSKALIQLLVPITKQVAELKRQISDMEKSMANIPVPAPQEIDVAEIAKAAAELVIVDPVHGDKGEKGDKGDPGESVDVEKLMESVKAHAESIIPGLIPAPIKGDDANNDFIISELKVHLNDSVLPELKEFLAGLVAAIPVPENGEKGEKGDSADPVDYEKIIDHVKNMIPDFIPEPIKGEDGKSIDHDLVVAELKSTLEPIIKDLIPEPIKGDKGDRGEDGASVNREDVIAELKSELEPVIKSLIPAPIKGDKGEDGVSADIAAIEKTVRDLVGEAVSSIPVPANGKDAADLMILPEIDVEKSYSRGSWAIHNGGLFHSYDKTKGMRGWECAINGICAIDAEKGNREIKLKIQLSDGNTVEKSFAIDYPVYKGVYSEDMDNAGEYSVGDWVTHGGSVWNLERKSEESVTAGRPGIGGSNWKLAIKRGDNAKSIVRNPRPDHTIVSVGDKHD